LGKAPGDYPRAQKGGAPMQNQEIARVFDEIADMLELTGANFFRVRAYRNAARAVRDHPVQFAEMRAEEMAEVPGIGEDLAGKIQALIRDGDIPLHRELRAKVPEGVVALMNLPGLGPKRVRALAEQLKIKSVADLKKALESGALESLRGFGKKTAERLRETLEKRPQTEAKRWLYAQAAGEVNELVAYLRKSRAVEVVEAAGSFRRKRDTVGDLDMLAISSRPAEVMQRLLAYPKVEQVLGSGETKSTVVLKGGLQVDLRVVPRESYGAAMVYFTGSKAHGVHIRRIAQKKRLMLNEYGLFRGERPIAGRTEEEIYEKLGLEWIAPELREDRGEVEAAAEGKLPHLIERKDLRGDLHTHSTYTDGRATIEEMALAARGAGLEYFAVTDHSQRLAMVHGLDPKRLRAQWREIEKVQSHVEGVTLLRGIEVDILDDGSLDLPDDVLAELDWVVASVHYKFDQAPKDMTRRLVRAIRNRNVDVIGHPSGRLLGQREPIAFDLAEVLEAARSEGCALEVNSQPDRLDLTDTACLAAKHAGVKLVISSDSHHTSQFGGLVYGVNQARRGWIEPADVLNTLSLKDLRRRMRRM
jgi:DNA polymerase (family 10)